VFDEAAEEEPRALPGRPSAASIASLQANYVSRGNSVLPLPPGRPSALDDTGVAGRGVVAIEQRTPWPLTVGREPFRVTARLRGW